MEGRAGMLALVPENAAHFDLGAFRAHLCAHLPDYARPLFLRFQDHLEITATFKQRKVDLVAEGFDPMRVRDPIFFNDPQRGAFEPIDEVLYQNFLGGKVRL